MEKSLKEYRENLGKKSDLLQAIGARMLRRKREHDIMHIETPEIDAIFSWQIDVLEEMGKIYQRINNPYWQC